MATVRYQVDGVPHNSWAHAWFPPPQLTPAGQFSNRWTIHQSAGEERVPSPRPRFDDTARHLAGGGYANGSDVAPNWFAPQVGYYDQTNPRAKAIAGNERGISYMPKRVAADVPPVVPIGTLGPLGPSKVAMGGRKVGGRRSMRWPRLLVRWPNLQGRYE